MEIYDRGKSWNVMTSNEVRSFDAYAINELGLPGIVLMENAGRSCAELGIEKLAGMENAKAAIFCGAGNNGGDGFVVARHLINAGIDVTVVICGDREKIKGDAKINLQVLEKMGHVVEELDFDSDINEQVEQLAGEAELLVDALFGTGLKGPLRGGYDKLVEAINELGKRVLAVDIPSGLNCDEGTAKGPAIRAEYTVTFAAVKKGFADPEARKFTGQVFVASIGVEPS